LADTTVVVAVTPLSRSVAVKLVDLVVGSIVESIVVLVIAAVTVVLYVGDGSVHTFSGGS
jgi:hypothetical protein